MGTPRKYRNLLYSRQYCLDALADCTEPSPRRELLEKRLAAIDAQLRCHCRLCGRALTDADSVARQVGPECQAKLAKESA